MQSLQKKSIIFINVLNYVGSLNGLNFLCITRATSGAQLQWINLLFNNNMKVMWHTAKYGDPYSEFVLCKFTHRAVGKWSAHTQQRTHTPRAVGSHLCCGTRGAFGSSMPCSRAPPSWYWRWIEHCTPPPTIPAGPRLELTTFYESNSLTIRPQLPYRWTFWILLFFSEYYTIWDPALYSWSVKSQRTFTKWWFSNTN